MKPQEESFLASLVAAAVLVGMSTSASAGISVQNWQLNLNSLSGLPGYSNVAGVLDSSINNLSFNGESYVTNTQALNSNGNPITGVYNSVDTGIFDITQKNGGVPLNLGGGQLTAYFTGTDTTTITGPNGGFFTFNGGQFQVFYNPTVVYGSSSANHYGSTAGTQIATFTLANTNNPSTSGGFVNADGTPTANGTVNVTGLPPTALTPGNIFLDSNGNLFNQNILLSFVTTNASEDLSANPNTVTSPNQYTIDPNLVAAFGLPAGTYNGQNGLNYFITNGGQFKLQYAPEPMTVALFGAGLLAMGWSLRRRSNV
ncbi:PEP-CTERM sorting domain-containing protein [Ferrovum sp.]|uniref:PEP-CTERM sorting domain-containing protein n=1 Tax=Ferrovum sp. TaxID=2609467 RepID=UPI0026050161|nr:PEP-CTERM sorting domain-containing protein [Ferrovum sp.]